MQEASETVGTATQLVPFGKAIEALKSGKRVTRKGWNGKGLFIFMQIPSSVSIEIVPKMTSLPQLVKNEFIKRYEDKSWQEALHGVSFDSISYQNQLAIVYPNNKIYGWVASPSDVLETDWVILD